MIEYRLKLPKQNVLFDTVDLTFSINHLRSRRPSIIYFILHLYDMSNNEILIDDNPVFISERSVVGTKFDLENADYVYTFSIPQSALDSAVYNQLEIRTLGVDSENPLYFSELMLQEGTEYNGYHVPRELDKMNSHTIELPSNLYANLYDKDGNYLQVIRPNKEQFNTNTLNKAQYTILAPHFESDEDVDSHIAVFLEAMNQREQKIDVLR